MSVPPGRYSMASAQQPVEQHVAAVQVVGIVGRDPVLQHRRAAQPELRRRRGGLADVVRLHRALRHQRVGALRQRLAEQEFQLAVLVAAGREPGAVVALDPELRPAERLRQVRHELQRRRRVAESSRGGSGRDAWRACFPCNGGACRTVTEAEGQINPARRPAGLRAERACHFQQRAARPAADSGRTRGKGIAEMLIRRRPGWTIPERRQRRRRWCWRAAACWAARARSPRRRRRRRNGGCSAAATRRPRR